MPLEISKLALQLDDTNEYGNSMLTALSSLYARYGARVFGVGYIATQYKHAAWTGVYFATLPYFDRLVQWLIFTISRAMGSTNPSSICHRSLVISFISVLSGFLAGALGALINRPGDTLRTIIQKRCFASADLVGGGGISGNLQVYRCLCNQAVIVVSVACCPSRY